MPHLWIKTAESGAEWAILPLLHGPIAIPQAIAKFDERSEAAVSPQLLVLSCTDPTSGGEKWVLIAPPTTTINGAALSVGIRLLRDKDEIRVQGQERMFFGGERLATIQAFAGSPHAIICPRCKQPVSDGAMSVRCPACGVVHHQTGELPCWLGYVDSGNPFHTCALCDQPAAVEPDARFRWSPEGL